MRSCTAPVNLLIQSTLPTPEVSPVKAAILEALSAELIRSLQAPTRPLVV